MVGASKLANWELRINGGMNMVSIYIWCPILGMSVLKSADKKKKLKKLAQFQGVVTPQMTKGCISIDSGMFVTDPLEICYIAIEAMAI